jgi:hypothetical protein
MKLHFYTLGWISGASAFTTAPHHRAPRQPLVSSSSTKRFSTAEDVKATVFDQEQFIATSKEMRLQHLEEQAMYALKIAVENYGNAVFPNAMIAGYVFVLYRRRRCRRRRFAGLTSTRTPLYRVRNAIMISNDKRLQPLSLCVCVHHAAIILETWSLPTCSRGWDT